MPEEQPRPDDAAGDDSDASGTEGRSEETGEPKAASESKPRPVPVSRSTGSATRTSRDSVVDEITPEYVEEETRRNDFVLRWAVVLLALLAGLTMIDDTRTLVHVKSGEHLASNGFLPPTTDPFSIAAADRTWANTEWLFDLLVFGVYSLGGPVGLTILKAVLAAATFGFVVGTSRSGASTWWGSICAAIAIMVCVLRFEALPELITLLGLAITLRLLVGWKQSGGGGMPWGLFPLFLVWANMDARVYLGLAVLLLYGLGEVLGWVLESTAAFETGTERTNYWIAVAGCLVAMLCNPFGWATLTAPFEFYAGYYPAMRSFVSAGVAEGATIPFADLQYFSLFSSEYWSRPDIAGVCGLFLLLVAFAAAGLNHRRLDVGALFRQRRKTVRKHKRFLFNSNLCERPLHRGAQAEQNRLGKRRREGHDPDRQTAGGKTCGKRQ